MKVQIKASDVIVIGQLPKIIQARQDGEKIIVSLDKNMKDVKLLVFLNEDSISYGYKYGKDIPFKNGQAVIDSQQLFGSGGKIILKLLKGDHLIDERIIRL